MPRPFFDLKETLICVTVLAVLIACLTAIAVWLIW